MRKAELLIARSGNSLRAAIAVELAEVEVDVSYVDLASGEQKGPDFRRLNPAGTVPVYIEHSSSGSNGPLVLTQSGAILTHLVDQQRPDLWPQDYRTKLLCKSSVFFALSDVAMQNALSRYVAFAPEAAQFLLDRTRLAISAACESLHQHTFLFGDHPTIADFAHFPVVYMREFSLRRIDGMSHIIDWLERMKSIDAIVRATQYAGLQLED